MQFQPLTADALPQFLDLSAQLYASEGPGLDRERARRAAQELMADASLGGIWLMDADGETAGYLVLTACFSLEQGGRFGLVDELFVAETWRGRGFGGAALEFAAGWCRERGMQSVRLEVWTGNTGAIRLYERAGFALEERRLMTRRL